MKVKPIISKIVVLSVLITSVFSHAQAAEVGPITHPFVLAKNMTGGQYVYASLFAADTIMLNQYCIDEGYTSYSRSDSRPLYEGYVATWFSNPDYTAFRKMSYQPYSIPVVYQIWCND